MSPHLKFLEWGALVAYNMLPKIFISSLFHQNQVILCHILVCYDLREIGSESVEDTYLSLK